MKKNNRSAGRIAIRFTVLILIGLLLGFGIYTWNAETVMGNKMPMPFGIGVSVVMSGSMEPELSVNDMIIVRETDELYKEQVVVFQEGSSLVVHRIKDIQGDGIITQGDANNTQDDPIQRDMIKGEVVFSIPYVGILVSIIRNPLVAIILSAAAIFLFERSFRNEKRRNSEELDEIKEEIKRLSEDMDK